MKHFNIFLVVSLCIAGVALFLTKQDEYRNDKIQDFYTRQKETSSLKLKSTQEEILIVQTALKDLRVQEEEECASIRANGEKERSILKSQMDESRTEEQNERDAQRRDYRELKNNLKNQLSEEEINIHSKRTEILNKLISKEEETNTKIALTSALIGENTKNLSIAERSIQYDADLPATEKANRLRAFQKTKEAVVLKNQDLAESIKKNKDEFADYKVKAIKDLRTLDLSMRKKNTEFWKIASTLVLKDPKGLHKKMGEEIKLSLTEENISINEIKEKYRSQRKSYESDLKALQESKSRTNADLIAAMNALKEPPREDIDKIALINGGAAGLILIFGIFYFMYVKSTAQLIE